MFTQLHIMPDSIYSRTELNGIYITFKFHHAFCLFVLRFSILAFSSTYNFSAPGPSALQRVTYATAPPGQAAIYR